VSDNCKFHRFQRIFLKNFLGSIFIPAACLYVYILCLTILLLPYEGTTCILLNIELIPNIGSNISYMRYVRFVFRLKCLGRSEWRRNYKQQFWVNYICEL
jgi:hypothetical protein